MVAWRVCGFLAKVRLQRIGEYLSWNANTKRRKLTKHVKRWKCVVGIVDSGRKYSCAGRWTRCIAT